MITPADIQNKEFSKGLRGYQTEEVDMFLDLITLDLEKLIKENINLKARLTAIENKENEAEELEGTVKDTLLSAKALMEDLAESSEKRAKALLHNAELDAALLIKEAKMKADEIVSNSKALVNSYNAFRDEFKNLLERHLRDFETDDNLSNYDRLAALLGDTGIVPSPKKVVEKSRVEEVIQPSKGVEVADFDEKKTIVNLNME